MAEKAESLKRLSRPLPPLPTTEERIARLVDWDFLHSPGHQQLMWMCRDDRCQRLAAFEAHFVVEAGRRGIPVHVTSCVPDRCITIIHSQYGYALQMPDWEVLGRLGAISARMAGVSVHWCVDPANGPPDPDLWMLDG